MCAAARDSPAVRQSGKLTERRSEPLPCIAACWWACVGGPSSRLGVGSQSTPLALTAGSPAITLSGADDVASRVCSTGSMSGRKFIQSLAKK